MAAEDQIFEEAYESLTIDDQEAEQSDELSQLRSWNNMAIADSNKDSSLKTINRRKPFQKMQEAAQRNLSNENLQNTDNNKESSCPPKRPDRRKSIEKFLLAERGYSFVPNFQNAPPRRPQRIGSNDDEKKDIPCFGVLKAIGPPKRPKRIAPVVAGKETKCEFIRIFEEPDNIGFIKTTQRQTSIKELHDFTKQKVNTELRHDERDQTDTRLFNSDNSSSVTINDDICLSKEVDANQSKSILASRSKCKAKKDLRVHSVHFNFVHSRIYEQILCSSSLDTASGPSIGIGWKFETVQSMSVDDFESGRSAHRQQSTSKLRLSKQQRHSIATKIRCSENNTVENSMIQISKEWMQIENYLSSQKLKDVKALSKRETISKRLGAKSSQSSKRQGLHSARSA